MQYDKQIYGFRVVSFVRIYPLFTLQFAVYMVCVPGTTEIIRDAVSL